jgi:hypothetical protein
MVLLHGRKKLLHVRCPGEDASFSQVLGIRVVAERLDLEGIVPVCNVMALAVQPAQQVEEAINKPMKNKQHLHLLPEVDLLVAYELCLVLSLLSDPDENEK